MDATGAESQMLMKVFAFKNTAQPSPATEVVVPANCPLESLKQLCASQLGMWNQETIDWNNDIHLYRFEVSRNSANISARDWGRELTLFTEPAELRGDDHLIVTFKEAPKASSKPVARGQKAKSPRSKSQAVAADSYSYGTGAGSSSSNSMEDDPISLLYRKKKRKLDQNGKLIKLKDQGKKRKLAPRCSTITACVEQVKKFREKCIATGQSLTNLNSTYVIHSRFARAEELQPGFTAWCDKHGKGSADAHEEAKKVIALKDPGARQQQAAKNGKGTASLVKSSVVKAVKPSASSSVPAVTAAATAMASMSSSFSPSASSSSSSSASASTNGRKMHFGAGAGAGAGAGSSSNSGSGGGKLHANLNLNLAPGQLAVPSASVDVAVSTVVVDGSSVYAPVHPVLYQDKNLCLLYAEGNLAATLTLQIVKRILTDVGMVPPKGPKSEHIAMLENWLDHCPCRSHLVSSASSAAPLSPPQPQQPQLSLHMPPGYAQLQQQQAQQSAPSLPGMSSSPQPRVAGAGQLSALLGFHSATASSSSSSSASASASSQQRSLGIWPPPPSLSQSQSPSQAPAQGLLSGLGFAVNRPAAAAASPMVLAPEQQQLILQIASQVQFPIQQLALSSPTQPSPFFSNAAGGPAQSSQGPLLAPQSHSHSQSLSSLLPSSSPRVPQQSSSAHSPFGLMSSLQQAALAQLPVPHTPSNSSASRQAAASFGSQDVEMQPVEPLPAVAS